MATGNRYADLQKQGFMRQANKATTKRAKAEQAAHDKFDEDAWAKRCAAASAAFYASIDDDGSK